MLFIEHPTLINISISGNKIDGTVIGTADDWTFMSDNAFFVGIVNGRELKKMTLHKHQYNLNELDVEITKAIKKLLDN